MLFGTIGQARVFLWMLAAEVLISLAADLAFGLGAAAIFCLALFTANYAALRLYAVLAAVLGFTLFMLGAYPALRRLFLTFYNLVCHFISGIARFRWIKVIFR